ncbi:UAP56-interacting factor like [Heracleum sosnowskyi]|uniref:UAP56-interacting factor like n=1 Tax=Heracleum sosnowskyi TaxID=360622 RepID=A0AAD8JCA6_9APIA|nr:UAP56-interacting factor like [Heracleum sosnowskyi]
MATKPLTTEAIAITEKKMDMTLDDIIKMSKNNTSKPKRQQRLPNKNQKIMSNGPLDKSVKVRSYMDSRSSLRQATLAKRRSNFQGNQFPLAAEHARKAFVAPIRNKPFNQSRTRNMTTPRIEAVPVQKRAGYGGLVVKHSQQQVKVLPNQRPRTLDSLFANMQEERMRIKSQQTNDGRRNGANMKEERMRIMSQQTNGGRRNGGGQQRQHFSRGHYRY